MADYNRLMGFYTVVGSTDLPRSFDLTDKFGFDEGASTPVFNYSYADVNDTFTSPISVSTPTSLLDDVNAPMTEIASLTIDKPDTVSNLIIDPTVLPFSTVFELLKYVFIHQDVITVADVNAIFNDKDNYVDDSIIIVKNDDHPERVSYITFNIDMDLTNTTPDIVAFKIYFFADDFIETESSNRYKVYLYEDMDGDNLINDQEWRERIIDKHIAIFRTGRYRYVEPYTTNFIEGNVYTTRTFYVYTLVNNFTTVEIVNAIKEFLLSYNTYEYCVEHYPDLFGGFVVNVYPINNKDVTNSRFITPVSFEVIKDTLISKGYDDGYNNYENAEVFYIGNETDTILNDLVMPFLAVETESASGTKPISDIFPVYAPRYTPFDGDYVISGTGNDNNAINIFHHLMYISASVVMGFMDISSIDQSSIPVEYEFSVNVDGNNDITSISFKILGTTYMVNTL